MYSLVSAPVLGFDLTRLEGGAATAELLLAALTLTPDDLPVLAHWLPDDAVRAELWLAVDTAARAQPTVGGLSGTDPEVSLRVLERAPIGTVDALLHCVRHDVLDWTWQKRDDRSEQSAIAAHATSLICDAIVASYLRFELAEPERRRLAAGWVAASRRIPRRENDLGPQHEAIVRLLDRTRAGYPQDLAGLATAADASRRDRREWAGAMHAASWAVHLSGRIRAAAAAQFLLVQAIDAAGLPVADRAGGGWNLLSGVVQALVVRDLIDPPTVHLLLEPYLAALGPAGLE